jgi:competence protein ComGF
MQYEADQKKDTRQESKKTNANTEQQADEEVYIGSEGKMIRRGEESKEMRDRRQDVRREYRIRRR